MLADRPDKPIRSRPPTQSQATATSYGEMIIRRASESDIYIIQDIAAKTWADTYQNILPPVAQAKVLARAYSRQSLTMSIRRGQAFLVAENRKHRIGFTDEKIAANLLGYVDVDFDGARFNLYRLYVLPSSQRMGLGRYLLSEAVRALAPGFVQPNERWPVNNGAASAGVSVTSTKYSGAERTGSSTPTQHPCPISLPAFRPIAPGTYSLIAQVERDNPNARTFYARMGFSEDKEENVVIGGISLPLIRISVAIAVRGLTEA